MKLLTGRKCGKKNQDVIVRRLKQGINRKCSVLREVLKADAPVQKKKKLARRQSGT